jgi:hypothetical protein
MENRLAVPQLLNTELPYDPKTAILSIYILKRNENVFTKKKKCKQMLIAASFGIAKNGNNPNIRKHRIYLNNGVLFNPKKGMKSHTTIFTNLKTSF